MDEPNHVQVMLNAENVINTMRQGDQRGILQVFMHSDHYHLTLVQHLNNLPPMEDVTNRKKALAAMVRQDHVILASTVDEVVAVARLRAGANNWQMRLFPDA